MVSFESSLIRAAGGDLFNDGESVKKIIINMEEQRLYVYEYGILRNSFLITSGLNNATPLGNHSVLAKVREVRSAWFYGSGSLLNYDLGWMPYNLRLYTHI
jgi:hypothetical protein